MVDKLPFPQLVLAGFQDPSTVPHQGSEREVRLGVANEDVDVATFATASSKFKGENEHPTGKPTGTMGI